MILWVLWKLKFKQPIISGKKLVNILLKSGFYLSSITGSHHILKHNNGRKVIVPCHSNETLGPGLLNKIIKKDLGMTKFEFFKLYMKYK